MITVNNFFTTQRPIFNSISATRPKFNVKNAQTLDTFQKQERTKPARITQKTIGFKGEVAGTGYVLKKVDGKKVPCPVRLEKVKHSAKCFDMQRYDTFQYTMYDGTCRVGFFEFSELKNISPKSKEIDNIFSDHPRLGITGDRIYIKSMHNMKSRDYTGIGECADQIVVEHCLKNNYPTKIVMDAAINAHALHYQRGYRFVDPRKNDAVKKIINSTPKGAKYQTHSLGALAAYLPKEEIEKIKRKIKNRPFLN